MVISNEFSIRRKAYTDADRSDGLVGLTRAFNSLGLFVDLSAVLLVVASMCRGRSHVIICNLGLVTQILFLLFGTHLGDAGFDEFRKKLNIVLAVFFAICVSGSSGSSPDSEQGCCCNFCETYVGSMILSIIFVGVSFGTFIFFSGSYDDRQRPIHLRLRCRYVRVHFLVRNARLSTEGNGQGQKKMRKRKEWQRPGCNRHGQVVGVGRAEGRVGGGERERKREEGS